MARCILHVGMPKSGSTSIQHSLRNLADDKFYYARILNKPSHTIPIAAMFTQGGNKRLASARFARSGTQIAEIVPQATADLEKSIEIADGRTIVLSGEGILHMHRGDLNRLTRFFAKHGYDEIEIIAYVRAPSGYISSAVQQRLKSSPETCFSIERLLPNYKKRFLRFDEVFGPDQVRLIKFDPTCFPEGDVVHDICAQLGIPLASVAPVKKNESITRLAAQLRYRLAVLGEQQGLAPLHRKAGVNLCRRLRPLDETRFRLAPSFTKPFIDADKEDVTWMEERLGQPLREDMLKDETNDVRGPADLLQPVPGIVERLRGILAEDGVDIPPEHSGDEFRLLMLIGEASSLRSAPGEEEDEEGTGEDTRAARQEQRQRRGSAGPDVSNETRRRRKRAARRSEVETGERRQKGAGGRDEAARSERRQRRQRRRANPDAPVIE